MDEAGGLALQVLGEVGATRDGVAVDLGGRRQRAALAALVIARGRAVTAAHLAHCVWGDDAAARGNGALHSYISHLRRGLQPDVAARSRQDVIARHGAGYVLRLRSDAVDAWRFEQALSSASDRSAADRSRLLRAALDLWRGPAYAQYDGESWAEAEIARLTELRAVAHERLLDARLSLGDAALLVPELEALVAEDPLREERWRLLALALYRAQRQGDALAALRRARALLADELGIDPGPTLRELERHVLAQAPVLDPPVHASPPTVPTPVRSAPPAGAPGPDGVSADLIDRDREVTALRRAVEDLGAGTGGVLIIEGPPGIGKTRLLVEVGRRGAAAGVTVLSARGSQLERSFGFGAVRQLFEPVLAGTDRRAALLVDAAASARGVFEVVGDHERADGSFAVLHGLYWLTVNLAAERPVVLSIDDVQWCDNASLRYLAYLVKRIEGLPVLVVVTLRTDEDPTDEALVAELVLAPDATVLRPQPLSADATGIMVRERLGDADDAFIGVCHRTTGGNPLLLRQVLRALESEGIRPDVSHADTVRAVGSRAVSSLVMLRLRRLPSTVGAAARAVAVLGHDADLPTVAALARMPEDRAADALDVLGRGEVLADVRPLAFVHPLVRDAVYGDIPSAERALQHERAARLLQRQGVAPDRVAAHLLRAPHRGSAASVAVLRAAARTMGDRGAADSAVTLLRRALDEPATGRERVDVLVELGLAETLVDGSAAVAHLCEAYALRDDPAERAELALVIARTQAFASPRGVAVTFAADAAAALPAHRGDARQGLAALRRIIGYMHALDPSSYREDPPPPIEGDGDGARMLAAALAFDAMLDGTDRHRAVELARFALEDDRLLTTGNLLLWVVAADVLLMADAGIGDLWPRAQAQAHRTGSLFAVLSVNLWQGFTQWRRGQLDDALQSVVDASDQLRAWGSVDVGGGFAAAFTAHIHLDMGDVDAADRVVEAARSLPRVGEGARLLRQATARLRVAQGRPADALETLAEPVGTFTIANPAWAPWRRVQAQALASLGRVDDAVALVDEEVVLLRRWGAPSSLGPSLQLAGELRGGAGEDLLREAVDVLASTDAVLDLARARLALGRRPDVADLEAVPLLREAAAGARACGARAVLREAVAALADRRQRVAHADDEIPVTLTGRERQVLDLTAAGVELHQVAQRLFLTPAAVREALASATTKARR